MDAVREALYAEEFKDVNLEFYEFLRNQIAVAKRFFPFLEDLGKHHPYTIRLSFRVAWDVQYVAKKIGLKASKIRDLVLAALIHDIGKQEILAAILDLDKKVQEKIAKKIKPFFRGNPAEIITVKDAVDYIVEQNDSSEIERFFKQINASHYYDQPLMAYLRSHQSRTLKLLRHHKVDEKLVQLAANHHPEYLTFWERRNIPKECKIIAICDKFNAMIQSEGIRKYVDKKTPAKALEFIFLDLKKEYVTWYFSRYEKKILKHLSERYLEDELKKSNVISIGLELIISIRKHISPESIKNKFPAHQIKNMIVLLALASAFSSDLHIKTDQIQKAKKYHKQIIQLIKKNKEYAELLS